MNKKLRLLIFSISAFVFGCDKINYYPDKPIEMPETKILAHRGAGFRNPDFPENTILAIRHSSTITDGYEVDIQISKDQTIWLSHNVKIDCN
ncbi:MAG: hypothetical protein GC181_11450 [Bacteroidetes bacterium]|nr:hypothetical protein [Bacteroidota bacterium]